jgi:hypothetical protein
MKEKELNFNYPETSSSPESQKEKEGVESEVIVEELKELLSSGAEKGVIASCLAYYDTDAAWTLREEILESLQNYKESSPEKKAIESTLATGLGGLESDKSWEWRNKFLEEGVEPGSVAKSLIGLKSEKSWEMREDIRKKLYTEDDYYQDKSSIVTGLFRSLVGLNEEEAWDLREKLLRNHKGSQKDYLLSLIGIQTPKAKAERSSRIGQAYLYEGNEINNAIMQSLTGLQDEWSLSFKNNFIENKGSSAVLLESLATDKSEKADSLREKHFQKFKEKIELKSMSSMEAEILANQIGLSIAGIKNELSNKIRSYLLENKFYNAVAYSICGDEKNSTLVKKNKK